MPRRTRPRADRCTTRHRGRPPQRGERRLHRLDPLAHSRPEPRRRRRRRGPPFHRPRRRLSSPRALSTWAHRARRSRSFRPPRASPRRRRRTPDACRPKAAFLSRRGAAGARSSPMRKPRSSRQTNWPGLVIKRSVTAVPAISSLNTPIPNVPLSRVGRRRHRPARCLGRSLCSAARWAAVSRSPEPPPTAARPRSLRMSSFRTGGRLPRDGARPCRR